jgi:predicted RNase H-related nuclease YkuK (DUF458 family)
MQKRYFKNLKHETVDVIDFCKNNIRDGTTVYVGTDSVVQKDRSLFVTVVAIRFGSMKDKTAKGVTFSYLKTYAEKYKDKLYRLREEAKFTMEMVSFLEDNFIKVDYVEFDYNSDEKHLSNKVLSEGKGWAEGLGYKVTVKPDEQVAVKAADYICRPR